VEAREGGVDFEQDEIVLDVVQLGNFLGRLLAVERDDEARLVGRRGGLRQCHQRDGARERCRL